MVKKKKLNILIMIKMSLKEKKMFIFAQKS